MAVIRGRGARRLAVLCGVAAAALCASAPAFGAECDPVLPKAEVAAGMTGTGWTVERGRTREPFAVEILGVFADAIAPNRDMILVEVASPAIGRAGGIWAGMSGSPVYVGGRLVGALAYGIGSASGNTAIGGLTPAEDMTRILTYPVASPRRVAPAPRAVLPRRAAREVADRLGLPVARASSLAQLRVPLTVSGVTAQGLRRATRWAEARSLPLVPVAGASASQGGGGAAATPLEPGDNLAAVAAYGDLTLAAVGTATYVCNSRVLGLGHPVGFFGPTSMGMSAADALTVVPSAVDGGFKLANVGETLGQIDQDRLAGVRGLTGAPPPTIPLRTSVAAPAQGTSDTGATDIALEPMAGFATFLHTATSIESTFDGMRPGTAGLAWTIEGTRANGAPWSLARSNLYASGGGVGFESAFEPAIQVDEILLNPFEDVRVTGVRVDASVREGLDLLRIERVLVAKGRGPFRKRGAIRASPGERIRVRVVLKHVERGRPSRRADFSFRLPRNRPPVGLIELSGASSPFDEECMIDDACDDTSAKSFPDLLRRLRDAPRNDVLTAKLRVAPRFRVGVTKRHGLDAVIRGYAAVRIGRGGPSGGGGEEWEEVVLVGD